MIPINLNFRKKNVERMRSSSLQRVIGMEKIPKKNIHAALIYLSKALILMKFFLKRYAVWVFNKWKCIERKHLLRANPMSEG